MHTFEYLLANKNQYSHEYVIRRRALEDWYFVTIELYEPKPVIWSGNISKAHIFRSEEQVEEFKYHFLADWACDIIMLK